jgi:acyl CoA:acetate/3-ketoacid CoA transferase alpha subunit
MRKKIYSSLDSAVSDIPDGARIMFGGFGGAGFPNNLIQALAKKGTRDITPSATIAEHAMANWDCCSRTARSGT